MRYPAHVNCLTLQNNMVRHKLPAGKGTQGVQTLCVLRGGLGQCWLVWPRARQIVRTAYQHRIYWFPSNSPWHCLMQNYMFNMIFMLFSYWFLLFSCRFCSPHPKFALSPFVIWMIKGIAFPNRVWRGRLAGQGDSWLNTERSGHALLFEQTRKY